MKKLFTSIPSCCSVLFLGCCSLVIASILAMIFHNELSMILAFPATAPGSHAIREYNPFVVAPIRISWFVTFLLYFWFSCFLGYQLLKRVMDDSRSSNVPLFLGSFFIGYLVLVSFNRLVSFFPVWFVKVVWIFIFAIGTVRACRAVTNRGLLAKIKIGPREASVLSAFVFLFLMLSLLHLQYGFHFLTGDATNFMLNFIFEPKNIFQNDFRLPFFAQHADEILFLYPVMIFFNGPEALNSFWLLTATAQASSFFSIYVMFRVFVQDRLSSILATILLCFGGNSLRFGINLIIFDSGGPSALSLHFGRLLPFLVGILFALVILKSSETKLKMGLWDRSLWLLFGAGISQITFNLFMFVFGFLGLERFRSKIPKLIEEQRVEVVLAAMVILNFIGVWTEYSQVSFLPGALFLIPSLIGIFALSQVRISNTKEYFGPSDQIFIGALFSALFLGNLIFDRIVSIFGKISEWVPLSKRILPIVATRNLGLGKDREFFVNGCFHGGVYPNYCSSIAQWLEAYHLIYLLSVAASLYYIFRRGLDKPFGRLIVFSSFALYLGFFVMDFVRTIGDDGILKWTMTRMIEGPYDTILFGAIAILLSLRMNNFFRQLLLCFFVLWFTPHLLKYFEQLRINFIYLSDTLKLGL